MQVVGPGYRFANAPGGPDDTIVEYDVATRRLVIRTDLFGVNSVCMLVRDGRLWVADSLARLHDLPETPKGMLPLGACVALCVAPAQRPSVFACGLSVIGGSVIECTPERIRTTPHWGGKPPATHRIQDVEAEAEEVKELLIGAVEARAKDAMFWVQGVGGWMLASLPSRADLARRKLVALNGEDNDVVADLWRVTPARFEVAEEDVPLAFEQAVKACELLLADDTAPRNLLFFRALKSAGHSTLIAPLGMSIVGGTRHDLELTPSGLPGFVARKTDEAVLARRLLKPDWATRLQPSHWDPNMSADDARWLQVRTDLLHVDVPCQARTAAAAGIDLRPPYLDPTVAANLLGVSASHCLDDGVRPPAARPIPPGGVSPRARANWIALYDKWLSGEKLETLEIVDVGAVREMLIAYAKLHSYAPPRVAMDRVLKKLTSLSILRERLG
ncbi:MAG: hypothetical protein IT462_12735 [Planctomycetes bacterium]|nr:hypothetical protein [Planctomycetota bacterium]